MGNWNRKMKKVLKKKYDTDKLIDKSQLCPCCFKKHREEYAVDFNGVFLRASKLPSRLCGEFSQYYNLIRLNRLCLKRHIGTMDGTISHELEHAVIYQIMRSWKFSEHVSNIGCLCVSKPSQFDLDDLRKELHIRKKRKCQKKK